MCPGMQINYLKCLLHPFAQQALVCSSASGYLAVLVVIYHILSS